MRHLLCLLVAASLGVVASVGVEDRLSPVALNPDEVGHGSEMRRSVGETAYASGDPADGETVAYTSTSSTKAIKDPSGQIQYVNLKKPYEQHLDNNRDAWTKVGGWSEDQALKDAKHAADMATKYVAVAQKKKEMSEIACPCEGEHYYNIVQGNAGRLADAFGEIGNAGAEAEAAARAEMEALAAKSASYGSDAAASLNNKALDSESHHSSWATAKRMIAKYGKPGPMSSWQPHHETKLKHSKVALADAQKLEDKLLTKALPEFKQVKTDYPEIFANGKCPCPAGWTIQDAAVLSEKMKDDAVAEASHTAKIVRHIERDPTQWYDPVSGHDWDTQKSKRPPFATTYSSAEMKEHGDEPHPYNVHGSTKVPPVDA